MLGDAVLCFLAWLVFTITRFFILDLVLSFHSISAYLLSTNVMVGLGLVPFFWLILFYYSGYYNQAFFKSRLEEIVLTFKSVFLGCLLLFFIAVVNDVTSDPNLYYLLFSLLFVITFLFVYGIRFFITRRATRKIHNREIGFRTLIVGSGKTAFQTIQALGKMKYALGFDVLGVVASNGQKTEVPERLILGEESQLNELIQRHEVEEIVVALDENRSAQLLEKIYPLFRYDIPLKVIAREDDILLGSVRMNTIYGLPMVDVTSSKVSACDQNIKQTLDFVLSFIALFLLSPLMLFIVLKIKTDSSGPAFYKQERIGRFGKPFYIYKFRSMYTDAERNGSPMLSSPDDNRITPFGRILRKYRLDELPQFWNVLKGDMALVGPRPERSYFIQQIVKQAPYYYLLHKVKPGITSWGMVKYGYASDVEEMLIRLKYDLLYIENNSLLVDLKILIYTVRTVFLGKGI